MENKSTEKKEKSKFRIYVEFIPFWCLYKLIHFIPYKLAMRGSAIMAAPMMMARRSMATANTVWQPSTIS